MEQLVQMRRDVAVADFAYCFGKMRGAFLEWKQLASFKAFIRDQKESHKGIAFYHSKLKILALKQWNEYIHQTRQKNVCFIKGLSSEKADSVHERLAFAWQGTQGYVEFKLIT